LWARVLLSRGNLYGKSIMPGTQCAKTKKAQLCSPAWDSREEMSLSLYLHFVILLGAPRTKKPLTPPHHTQALGFLFRLLTTTPLWTPKMGCGSPCPSPGSQPTHTDSGLSRSSRIVFPSLMLPKPPLSPPASSSFSLHQGTSPHPDPTHEAQPPPHCFVLNWLGLPLPM
jgi:hypothetical protein